MNKIIRWICIASLLMVALLRCSSIAPSAGNGTETGNASVLGMLYQPDGTTPAAGVRVFIRPRATLADTALALPKIMADTASALTNDSGRYSFDTTLNNGTYVIEATSGNNTVLIDSIAVFRHDSMERIPTDTLKPAGAIKGIIKLTEGGDPRKVFVLAFGLDRFAHVNADGSFKFSGVAEAKYDLRFISSLDNYGVLDLNAIPVRSTDTTNLDSIELPFTGIPIPKDLSVSYDTLKQIVTLTWKKADAALVKGYNVYRRNMDSSFGQTPINGTILITDTVYNDSSGIQDQSYEYKVVSIDKGDNAGKLSFGTTIKVVTNFALLDSFPQLRPADRFAVGPDSLFYCIYIGDSFIRVFDKVGDSLRVIGSGDLNSPTDVGIDSRGRIYAVSSSGINKYSADGTALGHWVIAQPLYLTIDVNDYVYVIFNNGQAIAKVDTAGHLIDSIQVQSALQIVAGLSNTVFVGDGTCQCIHVMDTSLMTLMNTQLKVGISGSPNIIAMDVKGRLYTRDIDIFGPEGILEVHIFDVQGTLIAKFQPSRGGDDFRIMGNTLYIIDRNRGLSTYLLNF